METKHAYEETTFWETRESWTVMGDWLGRESALQLLSPKKGELIIDAGCGEGLLTQKIALKGAFVLGFDRSEKMLQQALARRKASKHGMIRSIVYEYGDICCERLPVPDNYQDAIHCVAVLMHNAPEQCKYFFEEAHRMLKPKGRFVVSITHPYQYLPGSPTRDGRSKWTQFEPLEGNAPMDVSQKFVEHYRDIHGQVFDAEVWYHPEALFPKQLQEVGLEVVKVQSTYVRPEHISKSPLWAGSPWGHPAYYQILAVKP